MADQVFMSALADAKQNLPKISEERDPNKYGIVLSVSGPGMYTWFIVFFFVPLAIYYVINRPFSIISRYCRKNVRSCYVRVGM
jgi:hypothetical protein